MAILPNGQVPHWPTPEPPQRPRPPRWVQWLVLLAGVGAIVWFFAPIVGSML
jgi:hypothetical protein